MSLASAESAQRGDVVLVTGATGRIGRLLVDELLRAGARVRALTRRPERVSLPRGVEVVSGDFTIPESIDGALDGVRAVFLLWTPPPETAEAVIARLAAHSSTSATSRRIVYLSAPFRTPHPFFQQPNAMRDVHAEIERLLSESNLETTILRPGMFAWNAVRWWGGQIRGGDVVRWPYADAVTAPIDERDIAAVAARVLLDAQRDIWSLQGDYVLTGAEPLSHADQVRIIGNAIGRALRFEELSPDEFRTGIAATWPPNVVSMLLDAWRSTLGHPAFISPSVAEILGAPPRTFATWAADHAEAFARSA